MLPSNAPEDKALMFVPYWRLKGMLFSCSPTEINHRIVDVSHRAIDSSLFPMSVGLRSQALKLRFATPDTGGRFLQPTLPVADVTELVDRRFSASFPGPVIHQTYIGETLSMIYAPYYVDKKMFDAVLNEPLSSQLPDDFDESDFKGGRPGGSIRFLPTLCPHCGWDLKGQRDALVLDCENCASAWKATRKGFARLNASHLPGNADDLVYMPFWRIKADIEGLRLNSYADLVRSANLPKAVQPGMAAIQFHFWALAFKVRPQNFLKLSRTITLSQPVEKLSPGPPRGRKHPVTLSLKEGVESLKMTLAGFLKPKSKMAAILPDIKITPRSFILVYLPFHEKQHELVQPRLTMTINKNLLAHARNL
jgi:hypothetical protein